MFSHRTKHELKHDVEDSATSVGVLVNTSLSTSAGYKIIIFFKQIENYAVCENKESIVNNGMIISCLFIGLTS
jgi:hypothetical protein